MIETGGRESGARILASGLAGLQAENLHAKI
jgi:hypothetical protein